MSFCFRHPELVEGSVQPGIRKSSTIIDRRYLFIVAAFVLVGCSRITEADLKKIHNGMTTNEVKAILGEPIHKETPVHLGADLTDCLYDTPVGKINVTYRSDQVVNVNRK